MNCKEYTEKMIELCSKQAEKKDSYRDLMDSLEELERQDIEKVKKSYREQRTGMAKSYRAEQLALETEKQQLRLKLKKL
jgi:hypothetical protein